MSLAGTNGTASMDTSLSRAPSGRSRRGMLPWRPKSLAEPPLVPTPPPFGHLPNLLVPDHLHDLQADPGADAGCRGT